MKQDNFVRRWKSEAAVVAALVVGGGLFYVNDAGVSFWRKEAQSRVPQSEVLASEFSGDLQNKNEASSSSDLASGNTAPGATPLPAVHRVLPIKSIVQSTPLPEPGMNPDEQKGRIATLDKRSAREWSGLEAGSTVILPSFDGRLVEGVVNLKMEDNGWLRFGGSLKQGNGSFTLNTNSEEVAGLVLLPEAGLALEISTDSSGEVLLVERRISGVVCSPGFAPESASAVAGIASSISKVNGAVAARSGVPIATADVPQINTRPGANGLIYLDFDGEVVTDTSWGPTINGVKKKGDPITALPSTCTANDIREIVARVAEDFAPFDIAISTILSDYNNATVGRRMRVIVTPTDTAEPGVGGVAYVGSWAYAGGSFFTSTIPCWVFNQTVIGAAEAVSHEVGHTLGLNHDGLLAPPTVYYQGHGGGLTVPTSWAPIMGVGYYVSLSQWSKGEYASANNTQDDLAIIASAANGFGYRTPMVSPGVKTPLAIGKGAVGTGTFSTSGLLQDCTVPNLYTFTTTGGSMSIKVAPAPTLFSSVFTNVDTQLALREASGALVASGSLVDSLSASISKSIPAGVYTLAVSSAGTGPKPATGYTTGYSEYGSLGSYVLSGTIAYATVGPIITSPSTADGTVGSPFSFQITVSTGGVSVSGALPPGITFNPISGLLSGKPTVAGSWPLSVIAKGSFATTTEGLTITVQAPVTSALSQVFTGVTSVTSNSAVPWTGTTVARADGVTGLVAVSGLIKDNNSTSLNFVAQGKGTLSFYMKTSTEASYDLAEVYVNGKLAVESTSNRLVRISGETGWSKYQVLLTSTGSQVVEVRYTKNKFFSGGQDRVWLYGATVTPTANK